MLLPVWEGARIMRASEHAVQHIVYCTSQTKIQPIQKRQQAARHVYIVLGVGFYSRAMLSFHAVPT